MICSLFLVFLLVACAQQQTTARPAQPVQQEPVAAPVQQTPVTTAPVEQTKTETTPALTTQKAVAKLEADDNGFYLDGKQVGSIIVEKNIPLDILFTVRTTNVYHSGLDFRGCDAQATATPGNIATVSFTPTEGCTIKSFWPSTGVLKDSIEIKVE